MKKDFDIVVKFVFLIAFVVMSLLVVTDVESAPRIPRKKEVKTPILNKDNVQGKWEVMWGGVSCKMTFKSDESYHCDWPGTPYVGSWGIDKDGKLWITESSNPESPNSWTSYAVRLEWGIEALKKMNIHSDNPPAWEGPCEVGAIGIRVSLVKRVSK